MVEGTALPSAKKQTVTVCVAQVSRLSISLEVVCQRANSDLFQINSGLAGVSQCFDMGTYQYGTVIMLLIFLMIGLRACERERERCHMT